METKFPYLIFKEKSLFSSGAITIVPMLDVNI